jgi:putative flippase GtrA
LVGGLNTLVGYVLYSLGILLGLTYPLALLVATVFGILFNFKTMGYLVFNNTSHYLLFKFILVYGFVYCFQTGAIRSMENAIPNPYLVGFITILPAALITFFLNKWFVFREKQ